MDMTILNLALPAMAEDLRPSSVEQLWIVDIYSLVLAGLLVTASALGDRLGRRRMLVAGFVIFGAASLGVLLADSPESVIAIRVLLGVGGAMIMPSTLSLIRSLFPDARERATALGIWGATAAVGGALGPIVGGALLQNFSWHSAFLFNVPVMVVAVVAALVLLPESRSDRPGRLDPVATGLSIVGMVGLVYAIKELGKDGVTVEVLVIGLLGAALLAGFVLRCLRAAEPMLEIRLFRGRGFTAGVLTALITSFAMVAALLLISQWLQLVQGWSPLASGVALLPMAVGGLIGSPLAPIVAQRIGPRTVLVAGLAVGAVGFLLLFLLPQPLSYAGIAASLTLIGIGTAPLAVASAVIMAGAPVAKAGSAAAIEESATRSAPPWASPSSAASPPRSTAPGFLRTHPVPGPRVPRRRAHPRQPGPRWSRPDRLHRLPHLVRPGRRGAVAGRRGVGPVPDAPLSGPVSHPPLSPGGVRPGPPQSANARRRRRPSPPAVHRHLRSQGEPGERTRTRPATAAAHRRQSATPRTSSSASACGSGPRPRAYRRTRSTTPGTSLPG